LSAVIYLALGLIKGKPLEGDWVVNHQNPGYFFYKVDMGTIGSNVKEIEQWVKIMKKVCILPS
jgi:hypothetical protein